MSYIYEGPKGPTRRAYIMDPGWSPPPPRPEPLPERCRTPLTFEPGRPCGPTPYAPLAEYVRPPTNPEPEPRPIGHAYPYDTAPAEP